jgi:hypothetical protein
VIEAPIFIPFGEDRLAGIVALPGGRPRGLTLLLQGLGAPRSHKYGLWTRTARALAERGIASLRIDYQALGDSTGSFLADLNRPPVDEAVTAARHVMGILGVDVLAAVGNCMGGRTALGVAGRMPECIGVGCILPGNLDAIMPERGERIAGPVATGARRFAARIPHLKRTVRKMQRKRDGSHRVQFLPALPIALGSSRVMLLFLGAESAFERLGRQLLPLRESLPEGDDSRLRTETILAGPITSFRLPIDLQPKVIDAIVRWLDETMPGAPPDARGDASLARVAEEAGT